MKEFWIYLMEALMTSIGVCAVVAIGQVKDGVCTFFLILIVYIFLVIPAIGSWSRYFNEIFKNK